MLDIKTRASRRHPKVASTQRSCVVICVVALVLVVLTLAVGPSAALAQSITGATKPVASFPPLQQWESDVAAGNGSALAALYSTNPPARVINPSGESSTSTDVAFWTSLKPRSVKLDLVQSDSPQPGLQQVVFQAEVRSAASTPAKTVYIIQGQLWQKQGEQWKLVATKRGDITRLQQPTSINKEIYIPGIDAHAEIKEAEQRAARDHKRILIVFGANWCYDCHVLDLAFHRPDLATVLQKDYEVVHVDVGQGDKNQDIMQQYGVPMARGIPALAVLDSGGKLLYSQKGGEFEKARSLAPEDLLAFLNKWKPSAQ